MENSFHPKDAQVPLELKTKELLIRPLRSTDVELDYKAVMLSQASLLIRSNGRWPREGFTIEENLKNLEKHEKDFQEGKDFTFTIMNHSENQCLGCIYITPLSHSLRGYMQKDLYDAMNIKGSDAQVNFWMIPDCIKEDMDIRLLDSLIIWFNETWQFSNVVLNFGPWLTERDKELISDLEDVFNFSITFQGWKLA